MKKVITASRLIGAGQEIHEPVLVLDGAKIVSIGSRSAGSLPEGEHHDYPEATVAPAYFDIHMHGGCGYDVMDASPDELTILGRFLARHGVGTYFPTTITAPHDATLKSLSRLAKYIAATPADGAARPAGIHIEGPFLCALRKGAHPEHDLVAPTVKFLDEMWEASEGTLRLMTIAPELPGALEVIRRAKSLGIRVSIGHSDATYEQALAGLEAGANTATHTYNAMRPFSQREPGILGLVLSDDRIYGELICDGLHVHPAAVRLYFKAKGEQRAILVTDAMSATGMPDGTYKLGELDVRVVDGKCLIGENTLAGSTLTLNKAVTNFMQFTGASLATATRLAGRNPAQMAGLEAETGTLFEGGPADLLVLTPEGDIVSTWIRGQEQNS